MSQALRQAPSTSSGQCQDGALSDVRVLDLTWHIAGPYCTRLLAGYGADVIKVERPEGDPARRYGPFPGDEPHPEKSGLFLHLNVGKRGISLDLKSPAAKRLLLELVRWADVLVENFSPRVMPSLGLSYEELERINPGLIMTSVSNFGQTGPYRDYKAAEITEYAMGGAMNVTGVPEREPTKLGGNVVQYQVGSVAALATSMALIARDMRGGSPGEHVDVSILETQMGNQDRRSTYLVGYQYSGQVGERRPPGSAIASGVKPTADGYISLVGYGMRFLQIVQMLKMPELLEDPRFATVATRAQPENVEAFEEILLGWLMERSTKEVWERAQEAHILSGPVFTVDDLMKDEHFRSRAFWQELDHPMAGRLTYAGRPFIMSETPWEMTRPAPLLGQHNREVYCDMLGLSAQELVRFKGAGVV